MCQTILEEKCEEHTVGYSTEQKCDNWPKEVCSVEKRKVKKTSPKTGCDKIPKLMCAPVGCGVREVILKYRISAYWYYSFQGPC